MSKSLNKTQQYSKVFISDFLSKFEFMRELIFSKYKNDW
jgi:hypothetical protein